MSQGALAAGAGRHLADRVELRGVRPVRWRAVEKTLARDRARTDFHLAGYAHVGRSFQEPDAAWDGNLTATRCSTTPSVRWGGKPRILFVGSGLVYGDSDDAETPRHEGLLLRPNSPYAASKAAADLLSYQFTRIPGWTS